MSRPKLYFNPFSQPSNAVRLLIYANALEKEIDFVPLTAEAFKGAEFLKINPLGQVPALVDGDTVVLESAAIMEYLCGRFSLPPHWNGADFRQHAKINEYLHRHHNSLRKGAGAFFKTFFTDPEGGQAADVDPELQAVEDALKHIEKHFLASSPFVGGDQLSIADLQIASELTQLAYGRLLHDLFDFPKVAALLQAVRSAPGFGAVFVELDEFHKNLPPVKSAQVTIRGNREMLKNLHGARPKRSAKK